MLLRYLLLLSLCLLGTRVSGQELYRWVDEKGTLHFTDNFNSIPEKYRDKVERRRLPSAREPSTPPLQPQLGQSQPASQPQRFVVPFTRSGNAIIVEALVNGRGPIEFILDTGASLTLIPIAQAKKIGVDPEKGDPIPVTGVGGTVIVPLVQIDSINLGGAKVSNLEAAIHPRFGKSGLLGMDFLSGFRVDINYAGNQVTLEHQPGPHAGYSSLWWQQKFRYLHDRKKLFERVRSNASSEQQRSFADQRLRAIEKKINDLEIRASQAGIPRKFRQ